MIVNDLAYLLIKIVSVPIFILVVSVVGRRWGHSIGGLIVGLPLTSGPVLFFLVLEQGNSFGVGAAQGILLGLISVSSVCLVYSKLAVRANWCVCVGGATAAFFIVGTALYFISPPLILSFIGVLLVLVIFLRMFPSGGVHSVMQKPPRWEIPARIIAATAVVILITEGATLLGAHLSGLLTPFPAYTIVLGAFIHKLDGASASTIFLRGVLYGTFTSASFFFVNAFLLAQTGLWTAMSAAVVAGVIMHGFLFYYLRKSNVVSV